MPVYNETQTSMRQAVGRNTNRMLGRRTYGVTSASLANVVAAEDFVMRDATQGPGLNLYIASGGGLGQARTVVSAAAWVAGTGSVLYPHANFTTAPSTNAAMELWQGFEPTVVNQFIADAVRSTATKLLQRKEDYSLQLGDPMRHWGSFERWPSGAAAAPSGWTLAGAGSSVARESTLVYSGRYSAKVTNADSTTAYLESENIKDFARFAGKVATVKALVYTTTGARVKVQLLDGVNTFNSGFHDGAGGWSGNAGVAILIDNVTISNVLTQLKVRCTTDTGSVIDAVWGKVWMEVDGQVYDYDLPAAVTPATSDETAFTYISEVWVESLTVAGQYNEKLLPEYYRIDSDSGIHRIIFAKGYIDQYITPARSVKIIGQRSARLPVADSDVIESDPTYVLAYTSYKMMDAAPWDEMDRSKRDRLEREAMNYLASVTTHIYPDSVPVEAF